MKAVHFLANAIRHGSFVASEDSSHDSGTTWGRNAGEGIADISIIET